MDKSLAAYAAPASTDGRSAGTSDCMPIGAGQPVPGMPANGNRAVTPYAPLIGARLLGDDALVAMAKRERGSADRPELASGVK
jgi:hypothetical protein